MNNKIISWIIFTVLCLIWGSTFLLMKESLKGLKPLQIASLRIFSAGAVFVPFAIMYLRKVPRSKLKWVIVLGFIGNLFPAWFFAVAITKIDSSISGILNALTPICVIVIGALFFNLKITFRKALGIVVGFSGMLLLYITQKNINYDNLCYALIILLATIFYGLNINLYSRYLREINSTHVTAISLAFLTIPTGIVLFGVEKFHQIDFNAPYVSMSVMYTVILGLVGSSLASYLFYQLIQKSDGLFASMVTYGIPIVALFWGFILGEPIGLSTILCMLLIFLGVFVTNFANKKTLNK